MVVGRITSQEDQRDLATLQVAAEAVVAALGAGPDADAVLDALARAPATPEHARDRLRCLITKRPAKRPYPGEEP